MRFPRVALFEFMPYGAPELLESGPSHLARAVLTGALVWSLAFILLAAGGWFRVPHGTKPLPAKFDVILPPAPSLPAIHDPARAPKASASMGEAVAGSAAQAHVEGSPADISGGEMGEFWDPGMGEVADGITQPPGPPAVILEDRRTYEVHEVDQPPRVVFGPEPVYSSFAREAQVEGLVVVKVLVGRDGRVERAVILRSIPLLDSASLEGVRRWTFTPARLEGKTVAAWVVIPIHYRLH